MQFQLVTLCEILAKPTRSDPDKVAARDSLGHRIGMGCYETDPHLHVSCHRRLIDDPIGVTRSIAVDAGMARREEVIGVWAMRKCVASSSEHDKLFGQKCAMPQVVWRLRPPTKLEVDASLFKFSQRDIRCSNAELKTCRRSQRCAGLHRPGREKRAGKSRGVDPEACIGRARRESTGAGDELSGSVHELYRLGKQRQCTFCRDQSVARSNQQWITQEQSQPGQDMAGRRLTKTKTSGSPRDRALTNEHRERFEQSQIGH